MIELDTTRTLDEENDGLLIVIINVSKVTRSCMVVIEL